MGSQRNQTYLDLHFKVPKICPKINDGVGGEGGGGGGGGRA
jgi:hypothetical protein